jgi:hypothetical protein
MCLLHLDDATTYEPVDQCFLGLVAGRLRNLLKTHGKLLHTWQKTLTSYTLTPLAESLLQLEKSPSLRVPITFFSKHLNFLMDLLSFVLTNNYCIFDKKIYYQLKGTAMGTPTAVSYSTIFLYGVEHSKLAKVRYSYYTRYIDDVFAIFLTEDDAQNFNSFCPSIQFEAVTIGRSISTLASAQRSFGIKSMTRLLPRSNRRN